YFLHFSSKLLLTTLTLLSAIAAPAIIGFNKKPLMGYNIPAAMGMPIKLYIKAQNKFCLIVDTVCFEIRIESAILDKSEEIMVILATSIAISEPLPIAILTSAVAKAVLSLIPSPTIATILPSF